MDAMLIKATEIPTRGKKGLAVPPEKVSEAWVRVREVEQEVESAQKSLEEVLNPLRKQRTRLLKAQETKARTVAELQAKLNHAKASLHRTTTKLETFDAEVEDMGIPIVFLGVKKYRNHEESHEGRTTIKPDMIGAFEPIIISGPKRHGSRSRCTIEISSDGVQYKVRRIDAIDDKNEDYLTSKRLSDVTTSPGWLETRDVSYAVLSHLGLLEEYPKLQPISDPSLVEVNGRKLAA